MSCPTPWKKPIYRGREIVSYEYVPCGRCLACRIDKRNEWTWRLQAEINRQDSVFVTLTISDEYLLLPASVYKTSVQRFLKRLRKNLDGRKIKYFFVSEYGDELNTMRPHYHGILCNVSSGIPLTRDVGDIPLIRKSWPFGFIKVKPASKATIRYCLKYLDKQQDTESFKAVFPELHPPFRLMSKGLGRDWIFEHEKELRDSKGSFFFDGANRPLPRYYKELLFTSDEFRVMKKGFLGNERRLRRVVDWSNTHGCTVEKAILQLGEQELVDLRAKCNVGGKDIKRA